MRCPKCDAWLVEESYNRQSDTVTALCEHCGWREYVAGYEWPSRRYQHLDEWLYDEESPYTDDSSP